MTASPPLEADLKAYAAEVGPEPVIDYRKPDLPEQHRRWTQWWLEWYRRPTKIFD